ncbi:band 3 anion exchange protein-like [Salarias fasciatus]|uniref:band 3 anion exchange protein-like n=1 Tax=Salarias fasciatus TaxID=181472 RepID=UPI0011765171|nr:band 3 anion exchange protein-like [Salarias fasciatus]
MKDQKQQAYWQETGRWAGYEESFDPQAGVWASSQISYLTFKSLIQLRRTLNTGVTIFNCEETTLATIAEKMVTEMVNKKEIRPGDREEVLKSLLQDRSQPSDPESQALTDRMELQRFSVKERVSSSIHLIIYSTVVNQTL